MSEQPSSPQPPGKGGSGGVIPMPVPDQAVVVYRWPGETPASFRARVAEEFNRQSNTVWKNQRLLRKLWGYDDVEESQQGNQQSG